MSEAKPTPPAAETWRLSGKRLDVDPQTGTSSAITFTERPGGILIVEINGVRTRMAIDEFRGKLSASIGGRLYFGAIEKADWGSGAAAGSESDLSSQFPGKVRKLLVPAGAEVEAGTPLLLLEAMKMEFSVKAPFAGVVECWNVAAGEQVSPGQKFLELKPADKKMRRRKVIRHE